MNTEFNKYTSRPLIVHAIQILDNGDLSVQGYLCIGDAVTAYSICTVLSVNTYIPKVGEICMAHNVRYNTSWDWTFSDISPIQIDASVPDDSVNAYLLK